MRLDPRPGGSGVKRAHAFDGELVAFSKPHRNNVGFGLLTHDGDAMRAVAQCTKPGNVIGVQVGIDRFHQLAIQFLHQLEIAVDFLQHRVNDQRFAARPTGEQIGVGSGLPDQKVDGKSWHGPFRCRLYQNVRFRGQSGHSAQRVLCGRGRTFCGYPPPVAGSKGPNLNSR